MNSIILVSFKNLRRIDILTMSKIKKLFVIGVLGLSIIAQANTYTFTGNLVSYNDVVRINFSLAQAAANIRVWTNSFMNGDNFDPIVGLWNGTTGANIAENDNNFTINPSQTNLDAGFKLANLGVGSYIFTVSSYPNFSSGSNLADGFNIDSSHPSPIPNNNTKYILNIDDEELVANTVQPSSVPLPNALWLFGTAVFGFAGFSSRRSI